MARMKTIFLWCKSNPDVIFLVIISFLVLTGVILLPFINKSLAPH